jgi:tRNA 2-selenouridine synthase
MLAKELFALQSKEPGLLLIDARSPLEFKKGHIPGAFNLPLLDDAARAHVGTLYKTQGREVAVPEALCAVAARAQEIVDRLSFLFDEAKAAPVVIYCARGGMRSGALTVLSSSLGHKAIQLAGGYKSYRQEVLQLLGKMESKAKVLLNGQTGVGKTRVIKLLQERGVPAIDLEALAGHRGSAFGHFGLTKESPSQQGFENRIAHAFFPWRDSVGIVLELENALGAVVVPGGLRKSMYQSPMVYLSRDLPGRIELIEAEYLANGLPSSEDFTSALQMLQGRVPTEVMQEIKSDFAGSNLHGVIQKLLVHRYDKAYDRSLERHRHQVIGHIDFDQGESLGLEKLISIVNELWAGT